MQVERTGFYEPCELVETVGSKVHETGMRGEAMDYLAFVPTGKPTLDINLGTGIQMFREYGIRIEGESILLSMDMYNIQIATGSACSSKTLEPSHVLLAIGLIHEEAHGSMMLTMGHSSSRDDEPSI